MQTFLPYPDFLKSAYCLDIKRCRKQVQEALQIIRALSGCYKKGWINHAAVRMWRGYTPCLVEYFNIFLEVSKERGTNHEKTFPLCHIGKIIEPPWFGNREFHASHRSNLLRKKYEYYVVYGWEEPVDLPYVWPNK